MKKVSTRSTRHGLRRWDVSEKLGQAPVATDICVALRHFFAVPPAHMLSFLLFILSPLFAARRADHTRHIAHRTRRTTAAMPSVMPVRSRIISRQSSDPCESQFTLCTLDSIWRRRIAQSGSRQRWATLLRFIPTQTEIILPHATSPTRV